MPWIRNGNLLPVLLWVNSTWTDISWLLQSMKSVGKSKNDWPCIHAYNNPLSLNNQNSNKQNTLKHQQCKFQYLTRPPPDKSKSLYLSHSGNYWVKKYWFIYLGVSWMKSELVTGHRGPQGETEKRQQTMLSFERLHQEAAGWDKAGNLKISRPGGCNNRSPHLSTKS